MPITPRSMPAHGGRSVRGPLIARFTFLRQVRQVKNTGAEFAATAGTWAVADAGAEAGFAVNGEAANRLDVPLIRPDPWFGLLPVAEVGGVPFGSGIVMPWVGGEVHNAAGIGGAVVPVSDAPTRLSLRTYANVAPCQIRVFGGATAIPADAAIALYAAVL